MAHSRVSSALDAPLYTPADAARYLGVPVATVRSWVRGRHYPTRGGTREFSPVIEPAEPGGMLSFRNLVEIQVLRALRETHGVRLDTIRKAIVFLKKTLRVDHPLASARMQTDGKDLFVNLVEALVRADDGQVVFEKVLSEHLERVEWKGDAPVRLYPFPRRGPTATRTVVLDPRVRWGRPVLTGTAIPLEDVLERKEAGESVTSIARDYGRPVAEIKGALRYAA